MLSTPLTFLAPNAVILHEQHIPVFADIDEDTLCIDADDCLNKREHYSAKAGIWVHYAGSVSPDFYQVLDGFKQNGIALIEDCAHAAGARYRDGSPVGSLQDTIACFSYGSVKNLPTSDSGMLCTSSEALVKRARQLAYFGLNRDAYKRLVATAYCNWNYEVPELGWKYNGNDLAAAIASVQLRYLERDNQYRRQIYEWYRAQLGDCPHVQFHHHEAGSSHHLICVRVPNRDEVMEALQARKIIFGTHQTIDASPSVFSRFYRKGDCPVFERVSREFLCLPNHLNLTKEDVDLVCEVVGQMARS